jgi:pimeloyl-ACP methyl ester carboxylesterase
LKTSNTYISQNIYYFIAGTSTDIPLVLVHGYGASGYIWQRILPYLAQHHQVFVVDLPGYGRSTFTGEWRLREMGPRLAAWLRQMQLPPATIIGHSMGGAIAVHLAAYAPELVERLVLISAAGLPLQADLPLLAFRSIRSILQPGNGRYPLKLLRDALQPRLRILWQTAQEMAHSDFRAELTKIAIPTLIIWGEHDVVLPVSLGHTLSATIPQATFMTLPCGHRPMLAFPTELSMLILQFLRD